MRWPAVSTRPTLTADLCAGGGGCGAAASPTRRVGGVAAQADGNKVYATEGGLSVAADDDGPRCAQTLSLGFATWPWPNSSVRISLGAGRCGRTTGTRRTHPVCLFRRRNAPVRPNHTPSIPHCRRIDRTPYPPRSPNGALVRWVVHRSGWARPRRRKVCRLAQRSPHPVPARRHRGAPEHVIE